MVVVTFEGRSGRIQLECPVLEPFFSEYREDMPGEYMLKEMQVELCTTEMLFLLEERAIHDAGEESP